MNRQPYNLGYRFGADLRAIPDDADSMQAYIDFLQKSLKKIQRPPPADQVRAVVKLLGEIGAYAVILKKVPMARLALEESLSLIDAHKLGARTWAVHTIRYGDALALNKDDLAAETAFRSVLALGERDPEAAELEDFAWQHLGKLRFQQNQLADAENCFHKALALRKKRGIAELVSSTELALRVLKMKKPPG